MKKRNKLSWIFKGDSFIVGESINEDWEELLHRDTYNRPIVFYRKKVFVLAKTSENKAGLISIFEDFRVWANIESVFQVLKIRR